MQYKKMVRSLLTAVLILSCLFPATLQAARFKVLVVMSYEEDFPWCVEIREGIESALKDSAEIKYFYMDTKKNPEGGPAKAEEAFALYQEYQPDGVITADDNAQSMFVVPYLINKVKTPVMFCGVNAAPAKYGYPASNVSGILERESIRESLHFARQFVPEMKTFGFIMLNDNTGKALLEQINSERDLYPLKFTGVKTPKTIEEALQMSEEFKKTSDLLLYITLEGLPGQNGKPMSDKDIIPLVSEKFGKPMITNAPFRVSYGILCAVVKTGQEHGATASEMLLKAMKGAAVNDIAITKNQFGRRIINVDKMKALGIKPNPSIIRTAEIVKTAN